MMLDKNSFKVNGTSWGDYIVDIKFGYHKIWGNDSGRNQNATMQGTLKGVFPKLTVNFKSLTRSELEAIVPALDSAFQTIIYYDPNKKENTTLTTYSNDWEVLNRSLISTHGAKNEPFSVSFISTKKRV